MFLLNPNANFDIYSPKASGFPNVVGPHFRTNKNIRKDLSLKETVTTKQTPKFNLDMTEV